MPQRGHSETVSTHLPGRFVLTGILVAPRLTQVQERDRVALREVSCKMKRPDPIPGIKRIRQILDQYHDVQLQIPGNQERRRSK